MFFHVHKSSVFPKAYKSASASVYYINITWAFDLNEGIRYLETTLDTLKRLFGQYCFLNITPGWLESTWSKVSQVLFYRVKFNHCLPWVKAQCTLLTISLTQRSKFFTLAKIHIDSLFIPPFSLLSSPTYEEKYESYHQSFIVHWGANKKTKLHIIIWDTSFNKGTILLGGLYDFHWLVCVSV